ncbi:MAG: hypothetical protein V1917_02350 [Candidatus Gottesmanbacteria bacterium]
MKKLIHIFPVLFIILIYLILGYIFFHFIYSYSIRIPYADEWGVADVALDKIRLQYFFWQNNEHRAGTVFLYLQFLSHLTHWNMMYETMSIGILIFIASYFALRIKQYYLKSIDYWDAIIPFIFLNIIQYENLLWGINICHIFPTFFLLWAAYLFTKPDSPWKNHLLMLIALFSAYSSFQGLIVGVTILGYFIIRLFHKRAVKQSWKPFLAYPVGILCIIWSYFIGFDPPPYLGPTEISPSFIVQFIFREITAAVGYYQTTWMMWILPIGVLMHICVGSWQWIKQRFNGRYYIVFSLCMYSLLFMVFIVFGRGGFGLDFSGTSRYVTYLSPLFFGCYLVGRLCMKGKAKWVSILFLVWFVSVSILYRHISVASANLWHTNVELWRACYLRNENIQQCDEQTGFAIYNKDISEIQDRMNGLKQQKLNLFYR